MSRPEPGNRDVWTRAIVEQNRSWLMAYFIAATGDPVLSEDLVQDVFTAALENADSFDPTQSFGAWLRGIARNHLLMAFRNTNRRPLSLSEKVLDRLDRAAMRAESSHATPGYAGSRLAALRERMKSLTERVRRIMGLKYAHRRLSRQIAEEVGMKTTAVDMLLSRARRTLEDCISRKAGTAAHG